MLSAFHEIGKFTLSSLNLEQILDNLAIHIVDAGIFRSLMVALVDEKAHSIEVVRGLTRTTSLGKLLPKFRIVSEIIGLRYDLNDQNITAEVARTGEMAVIEEWDEERFDSKVDKTEWRKGQASYFIPVKKGDRVLAVLGTGSRLEEKEMILQRIHAMEPLLDQIAIALEHARLYQAGQTYAQKLGEVNKQLEKEVIDREQAEAHFRNLYEHSNDGIFVYNLDGVLQDVNNQFCEMLGYSADEMLSHFVSDFRPTELDDFIEGVYQELIEKKSVRFESQFIKKDGDIIDIDISASIFDSEKGLGQAIVRDVTNIKQIEETLRNTNEELETRVEERTAALQESEEKFRTLVTHATDGLFVIDDKGRFIEVNQQACESLGYTQDELLRLSVEDIDAEFSQDKVEALVRQLSPGDSVTVEGIHVTKDGSRFPVEVRVGRFELGGKTLMIALARDVTERKQLEEQLLHAQKMEAIGKLAGGVAHDFNNLLTVINGYSNLSLKGLEENDPIHGNLVQIQKAGQRAASLTNQLLAFSRRQMLQPKVVNLNDIVIDLQKMLHRLIGEDIELSVALNIHSQVKIDPGQLEQVIMNLTVNARDAMPYGGKLKIETADVNLSEYFTRQYEDMEPGEYVMLSVQDTGCGMDSKTLDRIFEPFFTTKEQGKGTGLGLSTAYGIVAQSGGCLTASSIEGRETTFNVYLPRHETPTEIKKDDPIDTNLREGSETILLVEDEDMVRTFTLHVLQDLGYQVLVAGNGEYALELCKQHEGQIDMLLTDVIMPQMSGKKLANRLL